MRTRTLSIVVAVLSAANIGTPTLSIAAVRTCGPVTSGAERVAATEAEGKRLALESWTQVVKAQGSKFAGWNTAINKNISCRRVAAADKSGKGRGDFVCQARASPCTVLQVPPVPATPGFPRGAKGMDV